MRPNVPVESTFTEFVRAFGGKVVSDLVGQSPNHANADYFFPSVRVIAELKCLADDKREDTNIQGRVQELFDRWMRDGTIPLMYGEKIRVESKMLPERCQRELIELYKPPIQRRILKANRQIKATAQRLRLDDYFGLLLLVNDGNYALEANAILYQVWRILGNQFRHINNMLYFTVNMTATSPLTPKPSLVWAQVSRKGLPSAPAEFLDALWSGWGAHLQSVTGQPIDEIRLSGIQALEHVRYNTET
jgi:hypothetical protein